MKRSRRNAGLALVAAVVATGVGSNTAAPATEQPNGPSDPLVDPVATAGRLTRDGVSDIGNDELADFLQLERSEQSERLAAAGLVDPGGPLSDPAVGDYLVGQWLTMTKANLKEANHLLLSSGKMDARDALELLRTLENDDVRATKSEIRDTSLAFGTFGVAAERRAKMTRLGTYLRLYLPQLTPEFTGVWVEDSEQPHLVVATAGLPAEMRAAVGTDQLAGVSIEVRTARRSRQDSVARTGEVAQMVEAAVPKAQARVSWLETQDIYSVELPTDEALSLLQQNAELARLIDSGEVELTISKNGAVSPYAIIGGQNAVQCTWGFVGKHGPGDQVGHSALLTAGHCAVNAQSYGLIPTSLTAALVGYNVDAGKYDFDDYWDPQIDNWIKRTLNPDEEITSKTPWAAQGATDPICHNGKDSGFSCGAIVTTSSTLTTPWPPSSTKFVEVRGAQLRANKGDSGGPFVWGGSAYGIFSSGYDSEPPPPNAMGLYGAIDFAESAVNFNVLTK